MSQLFSQSFVGYEGQGKRCEKQRMHLVGVGVAWIDEAIIILSNPDIQ